MTSLMAFNPPPSRNQAKRSLEADPSRVHAAVRTLQAGLTGQLNDPVLVLLVDLQSDVGIFR